MKEYFLNYIDGKLSIDELQKGKVIVGMELMIFMYEQELKESASVNLTNWVKTNLSDIQIKKFNKKIFYKRKDVEKEIFSENDFIESIIIDRLGFEITNHYYLRDYQHEFVNRVSID